MSLIEFNLKTLNLIPKKPGLYYLYDEQGRLLYIGKAVNLRYRLRQHQMANFWCTKYPSSCDIDYAWNQITRIKIEIIHKQFLKSIENIMILLLQPYLNR